MLISILLPLVGCVYQEHLPEIDIRGKVIVPRAAATRTTPDADGDGVTEEVTDVRLIGPVYLGAFAGIDTASFSYPHPAMGPIVTSDFPGNTFPFGGATVGRLDFACYEAIACKVTTGRFTSYDDVIDYFSRILGTPILDRYGAVVDNSSVFQQYCYQYFDATSEQEINFIDAADFVENDDGDFEADFLMAHTVFNEGMAIWGWMDAPQIGTDSVEANGAYGTCNARGGRQFTEYDQDYYEGRPYTNTLNYPSQYVYDGDWVSSGDVTMQAREDEPVVHLDVLVSEGE